MRTRLLTLLIPGLVLLVIGLLVPYAWLGALRSTQTTFNDRVGDATRFAGTIAAEPEPGSRLAAELDEYSALYNSTVWVIGLGGERLYGADIPVPDHLTDELRSALAGSPETEAPVVWPWSSGPMYVVEPVGRDSQVSAVVVIAAPVEHLQQRILRFWLVGLAVLLVPFALLVGAVLPLTRWALRPVTDLETAARRVRSGDLDARADIEYGPPELRELSGSFNAMVGTVQRSIRRQEAFAADAAHQLRNPLTGLQLAVDNLELWLDDPDAREAHADAVAEVEHMAQTLEAMLLATTLAGGAPIPDAQAPPLIDIFADGVARWTAVAADAGMTLDIATPGTQVVARQPAGGLAAVLDELISNATRLSGGTRILLDAVTDGAPDGSAMVEVRVADDGIGIPSAERSRATSRFWRASRHQNVAGTGLGLAILADVVTDAGGELRLEGNAPVGLRVVVRLPVVSFDGRPPATVSPPGGSEQPPDAGQSVS